MYMQLLRVIILLPVNHTMLRKHSIGFYYTFFIFYYIFFSNWSLSRVFYKQDITFYILLTPIDSISDSLFVLPKSNSPYLSKCLYTTGLTFSNNRVYPSKSPCQLNSFWRHIPMKRLLLHIYLCYKLTDNYCTFCNSHPLNYVFYILIYNIFYMT